MNVFARTIDDNLISLIKQIDKLVADNKDKNMAAFVVLLTDDPDAADAKLKEIAEKHKVQNVPLTIFDGESGPPRYKISKDADVTVLIWKQQTVKANHAYGKGKLDADGVKAVVESSGKILE